MPTSFGTICEGPSDHAVLRRVLEGAFGKGTIVNAVQPEANEPGGWTLVFGALRAGKLAEALQFNAYVVVQIDTDVCEHAGYDVSRRIGARERTLEELVEAVRLRLVSVVPDWDGVQDRVLFAIAVDGIECWLLPALTTKPSDQKKITGCLAPANGLARKAFKLDLKSGGVGERVNVCIYEKAAEPYRKPDVLRDLAPRNPSFGLFVASLDLLRERIANESS